MHTYDTLIIGSGYTSAGYALSHGNCIICEQSEICDTHFYLPMKNFTYSEYNPRTDFGIKLNNIFTEFKLFGEEMQNVNGFESAFCTFLEKTDIEIILNCRVLEIQTNSDGINEITILTNSGIEKLFANNILNTHVCCDNQRKYLTVLFVTEDFENVQKNITEAFPDSYCEKAFYDNRYALYVPTKDYDDLNAIKLDIYKKWSRYSVDAKILYMAPVAGNHTEKQLPKDIMCDDFYSNPIEAFEAPYFCNKEK